MEIVDLRVEDLPKIQAYLSSLRLYIPYYYNCSISELAKSFFIDEFEEEVMFKDLVSKGIIKDDKLVGIIQYGLLNFDLAYDGEKIHGVNIGDIRIMACSSIAITKMYKLLGAAMLYFKIHKVDKIYAFEHTYGLSCFGGIGKLYHNEWLIAMLLRSKGFRKHNKSLFLSRKIVEGHVKAEAGISFIEEELGDNRYFYTIKKYLVEVGGLEFQIVEEGRKAYLRYFYILDEHQGHHFGKEAMKSFLFVLLEKGIMSIDCDVDELNGIGMNFYEKCKFGNLGYMLSYKKE